MSIFKKPMHVRIGRTITKGLNNPVADGLAKAGLVLTGAAILGDVVAKGYYWARFQMANLAHRRDRAQARDAA